MKRHRHFHYSQATISAFLVTIHLTSKGLPQDYRRIIRAFDKSASTGARTSQGENR